MMFKLGQALTESSPTAPSDSSDPSPYRRLICAAQIFGFRIQANAHDWISCFISPKPLNLGKKEGRL
jgi:hypothetical protein